MIRMNLLQSCVLHLRHNFHKDGNIGDLHHLTLSLKCKYKIPFCRRAMTRHVVVNKILNIIKFIDVMY